MGKYLILWTQNPMAPWPTDPAESLKLYETFWAMMDGLMKKGDVKELCWFLNTTSGYAIGEGDSTTVLKNNSLFSLYFNMKVQEAIPYETGKQVLRASLKAVIEAT